MDCIGTRNNVDLTKLFKDYLFPVYCLGCGVEGEWVCEKCLKTIRPEEVFCFLNYNGVVRLVSPYKYSEDNLLGKLLKMFKYNYVEELELVFNELLKKFVVGQEGLFKNIEKIIPVPLHRRRLAERGFNQAELLAVNLSKLLQKPVSNCLVRDRYTQQQARLDKSARKSNVAGAFGCEYKPGNKVLLVDDVFTSGATIDECVRTLKEVGVQEILVFTLAKA